MCGIAGILRHTALEPQDAPDLRAMLERMRFRGPDDEGVHAGDRLAFGTVRLSIIGLANGRQPIFDEAEETGVVCNGEIFNYVELGRELAAQGFHFRTDSDVEVLVHGYRAWGLAGLLARVRGMYAFALWDRRRDTLHLVRDPFGIKPLYYARTRGALLFASDLNALAEHRDAPKRLDLRTLRRYLAYGYPIGPETFLEGVRQLPPGCVLSLGRGVAPEPEPFWNVRYAPDPQRRELPDLLAEIDALIRESVALHTRSDVPLGILLSSGIDSATLLSYVAEQSSQPVRTFTLNFADPRFGEGPDVRGLVEHFGTEHHEIRLDTPSAEEVDTALLYLDQPNFDYSCIPTWFLARFAREQVKVVLMGDGGDEIFAGYPTAYLHRVTPYYARLPRFLRERILRPAVEALPASHELLPLDYKLKRFVRGAEGGLERGHYAWKLLFDDAQSERLLAPAVRAATADVDPFDAFAALFAQVADAEPLDRVLYVDLKTFLVDDLLVKADRMTMAASLEARVPLLDRPLVECMARVPERTKLPGFRTKWLLRTLARERLPARILRLRKRGFTPPFAKWIDGPLRPYVEERILASRARKDLFDGNALEGVLASHFARRADYSREIALLLSLAVWYDARFGA